MANSGVDGIHGHELFDGAQRPRRTKSVIPARSAEITVRLKADILIKNVKASASPNDGLGYLCCDRAPKHAAGAAVGVIGKAGGFRPGDDAESGRRHRIDDEPARAAAEAFVRPRPLGHLEHAHRIESDPKLAGSIDSHAHLHFLLGHQLRLDLDPRPTR